MKTPENAEKDFVNDGSGMAPIYRGNDTEAVSVGTMCMANASRFEESNYNVPLTTYAVDWKDPNRIDQTLEFVAPMVSVGRRFTYMVQINAEQFFSEIDDTRAIGADFARVEYTSSKVAGETLNKGLVIRVDKDEVNDMPNYQEVYTGRMMQRLLRNELRRAVNILVAAAQAGTGTGANAPVQQVTWNATQGVDPDMNLTDACTRYVDAVGLPPNRLLMSHYAWTQRLAALRVANNPAGYHNSIFTPQQLADFLMLDSCYVSKERFTTGSRVSATKTPVFGPVVAQTNPAVIYLAESGQTTQDSSNIKRFVSATEGGTPFRVYTENIGSKFVEITVEHYSLTVSTSSLGVQLLQVSNV